MVIDFLMQQRYKRFMARRGTYENVAASRKLSSPDLAQQQHCGAAGGSEAERNRTEILLFSPWGVPEHA